MGDATLNLLKLFDTVRKELNADVSLRQLAIFMYVAAAGGGGIESATLERRTGASQAAVSRCLTKLSGTPGNWGLVDFAVDPSDRRRTYAVLSTKGRKLHEKLMRTLIPEAA